MAWAWAWAKYLVWVLIITALVHAHLLQSCMEEERIALLRIKAYMKSYSRPEWFDWNPDGDKQEFNCCHWEIVHCDSTTGRVTELDLSSVVGRPFQSPNWLFNMTLFSAFKELMHLDLSWNDISGLVENNGSKTMSSNLNNLQSLDLSHNPITPNHIIPVGSFVSLRKLSLQGLDANQSDLYQPNFPFQVLANMRKLQVLDLSDNNFNGTIQELVTALANPRRMQVLDLRHNNFHGSILGACESRNLEELYLSNNHLYNGMPWCLHNLTSLQHLDLSYNQLDGKLSNIFSNLTSLEELSLSDNYFEGKWPLSSLANLSKLKYLSLGNNRMEVQIEDSMWRPTFQLHYLDLGACSLNKQDGSIPNFFSHQYSLYSIDISDNNLIGPFPTWLLNNNSQLPELYLDNNPFTRFREMPNSNAFSPLEELDISGNNFGGQLPENIGFLFPQLRFLSMSRNQFQGQIPTSIGHLGGLESLNLSMNNFSGEVPRRLLSHCYCLIRMDLSYNNLEGDITPDHMNLTSLEDLILSNNHFGGIIKDSLQKSSELFYLDVSNNNVIGRLPGWISNFSNLNILSTANNFLRGQIPVEISQIQELIYLDVSQNYFTGQIPNAFPYFSYLYYMNLQKNSLTGPMPNALSNCSYLATLDLTDNHISGGIPLWINKLSELQVLLLGRNNLQGQLPYELCQLQGVDILDLSHNNLSGKIPTCFGNMSFGMTTSTPREFLGSKFYTKIAEVEFLVKNQYLHYVGRDLRLMSGLDLSSNRLIGIIPPELGDLSRIHSLNMSHNHLTGSIPSSFSNLKQIESLDLSYNDLSGTIPSQLVDLNFLEIFNVSYNNLTGNIPNTAQFANFDHNSFLGNPGLCGSAVNKSCHPVNTLPLPTKEDGDEEDGGGLIDMEDFLWCFGMTFIVMFLATVVVLVYINPRWHGALYDFIEWHVLWWFL